MRRQRGLKSRFRNGLEATKSRDIWRRLSYAIMKGLQIPDGERRLDGLELQNRGFRISPDKTPENGFRPD